MCVRNSKTKIYSQPVAELLFPLETSIIVQNIDCPYGAQQVLMTKKDNMQNLNLLWLALARFSYLAWLIENWEEKKWEDGKTGREYKR